MSDQAQLNKYKNFQSFKDMIASGLKREFILKELKLAENAMITEIPAESLCWLTARYLDVNSPKPNIKVQFSPSTHQFKISQLNEVPDNTFINIKGRAIRAFFDKNRVSLILSDMKSSVRVALYDDAKHDFENRTFNVGDMIILKNIQVVSYKGKKELKGNYNVRILKLINKRK